MGTRPRIALTLGDPAGIGPEVALAAMADPRVREEMDVVALGPGVLRPREVPIAAADDRSANGPVTWIDTGGPERWELGRAQKSTGEAALSALRRGAELAMARAVDALVTAPVSKEALHLAGERVEGQTELLGRWAGARDFGMLAVAGRLRVMLLTRHMPLRAAIDLVAPERVLGHLALLDRTLRSFGFERPRLALAGLNPHAGEGGLLGSEEGALLEPALVRARAQGLDVAGPISPDAVFLQALRGRYDGVLALYHDQAFIPVKLAAPDRGLTVIAGLSYLRVSPAHGTAFDIAGKGIASPANLILALRQAAAWASGRTGDVEATA